MDDYIQVTEVRMFFWRINIVKDKLQKPLQVLQQQTICFEDILQRLFIQMELKRIPALQ